VDALGCAEVDELGRRAVGVKLDLVDCWNGLDLSVLLEGLDVADAEVLLVVSLRSSQHTTFEIVLTETPMFFARPEAATFSISFQVLM